MLQVWLSSTNSSEIILKLVIFDFDGTLVDSRPLILESHRIVFAEFRLPAPSPAHSLALVGKSLDVILAELAGPSAPILEMVRAYDLLLPKLRADPAFAERPFDGVDDLLHELSRAADTVLGIATGHRSDTIAPALHALRWNEFFRTIQAADTAPSKPHPAMLASGARRNRSGGQRCDFHRRYHLRYADGQGGRIAVNRRRLGTPSMPSG